MQERRQAWGGRVRLSLPPTGACVEKTEEVLCALS